MDSYETVCRKLDTERDGSYFPYYCRPALVLIRRHLIEVDDTCDESFNPCFGANHESNLNRVGLGREEIPIMKENIQYHPGTSTKTFYTTAVWKF